MPSSIKADCSVADSASILSNWLNSLPANSTPVSRQTGAFLINSTLGSRSPDPAAINQVNESRWTSPIAGA
jgi:hypothetical protein